MTDIHPVNTFSAVILSAGSSQRMGCHKALLSYNREKNFLQHIAGEYLKAGINQVIVVVSPELSEKLLRNSEYGIHHENVRLSINTKPELGRFFSLQTGIRLIDPGSYCFFQNIDNPFTTAKLLAEIIHEKDKAEVVLPVADNKTGHPVLLGKAVTQAIAECTDSEIRIDQFLKKFSVHFVETCDRNILTNINTYDDYRKAGF